MLVLLVLVASMGLGSGSTDPSHGTGKQAAADADPAGAGDGRYRIPDSRRATVALPAIPADHPVPLRLTRGTLEQAWQAGRLDVALPGGGHYAVALEDQRFDPGGQWTVVGRVQTRLGPQAMVLTFGPEAVFGVLPRPDGSLLQITSTRGKTEIAAAGGLLPPGRTSRLAAEPDYMIPGKRGGKSASRSGATRMPDAVSQGGASVTEIVVLGLYTDDLVDLRGSVSAAETEMTNLFAITNQTHVDSGTGVRFKLAGLKRIAVDPAVSNQDALYAVTNNAIAGVDLFKLRDDMAADLLALVRPYHDTDWTCGIAWMNGGGRMPQAVSDDYGVSVSNVAPCGPYVLPHELGHNLGSAHDRETMTANGHLDYGVYEYSFGYRQDGPPAFATVMAYPAGNQPWLGYFSSPGSTACGAACGVQDRADNVRSLQYMAPVIAAFRGPPGTLSIVDAEVYETDTGSTSTLVFDVRLSGAAPAGGVQFDAVVTGGSAQAGVDYLAPTITGTIPEGQRTTSFAVQVVGDTTIEPDETIQLKLANVTGATVYDGEAVGRILNDDPRLKLSGHILFDKGVPAPASDFGMTVNGLSSAFESTSMRVSPPDFAYQVSVVKGASPTFVIDAPPPFAILPFAIDEVRSSQVRDIKLRKGVHVSGRVKLPPGQPALTESMSLDFRASIDGVYQMLPRPLLEPPNFEYSQWVVPSAWVYMELWPPAPYQRFFANNPTALADFVQDIPLSTLPTLIIWTSNRILVGKSDWQLTMQLVVQLSAPAPVGGVHLHYRTVDGTATAGSDYVAMSGDLEIPEGETIGYTKDLVLLGDDELEGNEEFQVVVSNVTGANPAVSSVTIILDEQNPPMSAPLPPSLKP